MRRRVFWTGENAMIGTLGRARLTLSALDPDSVKATKNFAPISFAVFTAPRAIASATLVARAVDCMDSKNGLFSASIAMRLIIDAASDGKSPVAEIGRASC